MTDQKTNFEFVPQMSEIAREAGALLMEFFRRRVKIEYKGDADLVTEADRTSEKLILERIRKQWPSHDVIGEEGARMETGGDYRWYVDPLDGTTNFAHGFPVFCVSLGLAFQGKRKAAVVYDPTRDELFAAERGKGAVLNGEKIEVSKTPKLAQSLVATGFPSHKRHKNPNIYFYHQLTLRSHGVRRAGSAALDLAYCGVRAAGWLLGIQFECMGHGGRDLGGGRSWREGVRISRGRIGDHRSRCGGEQWLIHRGIAA